MTLLFYIAHAPFDEASQKIVNVCIKSIQKYHPESEIRVCYSESRLPASIESSSSNVSLIRSPIQNGSVIGPFYHYLQSQDTRKAVFMHDSMILKGNIDMCTMNPFGFLWHFEGEEYIGVKSIVCKDLQESFGNLLREYPTTHYVGCFGLALYSEREHLQKLCDTINFLSYVNHPDRANALMDLERILGFWACALNLVSKDENYISICGSIFKFPCPFCRWYTNQSLEEIERINYPMPIVKAWMNRFLRTE